MMQGRSMFLLAWSLSLSLSCGTMGEQGSPGRMGDKGDPGTMGAMGVPGEQVASPPGLVVAFAGQQPPAGWLLCDGSPVDRATYAALFAVVGVAYGPGDANKTFNLPDLRGRTSIGVGQGPGLTARSLGQQVGAETHKLTVAQMPAHNHSTIAGSRFLVYNSAGSNGVVTGADALARVDANNDDALMGKTGGDEPHSIMPPSLALNYIIKF